MLLLKDIDIKDDPEFEFDDDDNLLAAMLPNPVTKLTGNPSCAGLTIIENPVQRLPHATETGPTFTRAHASTSTVTPNFRQNILHTHIVGSTGVQTQATTSTATINPTQSVPSYTETSLSARQAHAANASVTINPNYEVPLDRAKERPVFSPNN